MKVNIYLADLQNWETMNKFYREYIDEAAPPARTTVQVAGLNNNYRRLSEAHLREAQVERGFCVVNMSPRTFLREKRTKKQRRQGD